MNGKKAKAIRKHLGLKKPTHLDGGGLYMKEGVWMFKQASNPEMNQYRRAKKILRHF